MTLSISIGFPYFRVAIPSFAGAYDATPDIAAAYGMRRLRTAYTGNILRLRRASDNAESDFGYTESGDLDTAAIATWLTATTGYVVTWYDQSGNSRNATQTTVVKQPLYVASGQNSRPVLDFDGTDDSLSVSYSAFAQPNSYFVVAMRTSTGRGRLLDTTSGRNVMSIRDNDHPTAFNAYAGAFISGGTANSDTWYVVGSLLSGASSLIRANGTEVATGNAGTQAAGATLTIANDNGGGAYFRGRVAEVIASSGGWSTANFEAAETAANTYWSVYA